MEAKIETHYLVHQFAYIQSQTQKSGIEKLSQWTNRAYKAMQDL